LPVATRDVLPKVNIPNEASCGETGGRTLLNELGVAPSDCASRSTIFIRSTASARRQADVFTDLIELQSKLGRDPSDRPAPRNREARGPMLKFLQEPNRNDSHD